MFVPCAPAWFPLQPSLPVQQFAFAADEPIPDSPEPPQLSVEFSEVAVPGPAVEQQQQPAELAAQVEVIVGPACPAPSQSDRWQQAEQADQGEQLELEALAATSIQQYTQVRFLEAVIGPPAAGCPADSITCTIPGNWQMHHIPAVLCCRC